MAARAASARRGFARKKNWMASATASTATLPLTA